MPLPEDVATALGETNPIRVLVRNGFRRNRRDNSPRLIASALKNGYRFLALLSRAAAGPGAPEHAAVLSFLRENNARVLALRERAAAAAADAARLSTAPRPDRVPLLTRVSAPGEHPPRYVPTADPPARPLSAFPGGVRKPPTLAATNGVPFLRLAKPQPRFLERVLRQKSQRRAKRIERLLELQFDDMETAGYEDDWEDLVDEMLAEHGQKQQQQQQQQQQKKKKQGPKQVEPSYQDTLWDVVVHLSKVINLEREDMVARAKAMWQIVQAEEEMALKEEKERLVREGRADEEPKPRVWKRPVWEKPASGVKAKGAKDQVQA